MIPSDRGDLQEELEKELRRLEEKLGSGYDLKVVWSPRRGSKISGEVKGDLIYVYEDEREPALETLKHELIDYRVSRAVKPYKDMANKFIELFNERAYRLKEDLVEDIGKLIE